MSGNMLTNRGRRGHQKDHKRSKGEGMGHQKITHAPDDKGGGIKFFCQTLGVEKGNNY